MANRLAQPSSISEGQVWTFKGASTPEARVVIQKIEPYKGGEDAVHVSVFGLPPIPGRFLGEISHMPFARSTVEESIERQTDDVLPEGLSIAEGYRHWQEASGGIFTIPIAEAAKFVLDTALAGRIVE